MDEIAIDGGRLWDSLMEMARIGATPAGGCRRLALSEEDREARDLLVRWCRECRLEVRVDPIGNIYARRAGSEPGRAAVGTGSHLDTQPHGGRFDGVYGVLAGLEVLRTLEQHRVSHRAPIELVVWTNEEGARFAPSMIASGVYAGVFDLDFALSRRDRDGVALGDALAAIGYAGDEPFDRHRFAAFFEAHIEQGPVLEREGQTIGIVTGVQGMDWYDVELRGCDAHAGSTPMEMRRDALLGAAALVGEVAAIAAAHAPLGVATCGQLEVSPNSRNTVPGHCYLTVDLRHPEAATLARMAEALADACARVAATHRLEQRLTGVQRTAPVRFDEGCVASVRRAAERLGLAAREICSGAGHDACHVSEVAPTAMIFVPCAGGVSHNERESATPEDLAAGCAVLLEAVLEQAGRE